MNETSATDSPPNGSSTRRAKISLVQFVADIFRYFPEQEDLRKKITEKKILAKQHYAEKQYEQALEIFSEIIYWCPRTPEFASLYADRSICQIKLSRYPEAIEDARKSLKLSPKYISAFQFLITSYIRLGDLPKAELAIASFKRLKLPDESLCDEVKQVGILRISMEGFSKASVQKDYKKVVDFMDQCCEISPASVQFKVLRASYLTYLEKYTEAETYANGILNIDKQNADALYVKAICLYYQGNINQAFTDFQEVLRRAPDHERALDMSNLARELRLKKEEANAAFGAGDLQKAWDLYDEALLIDPKCVKVNAKLYFNKALVAYKMHNTKNAISQFTQAIKLDNNYIKAIFMRSKCYVELDQYELAICDLEKAWELDKTDEIKRLLNKARQEKERMLQEMNQNKNYYKILDIKKNASTEDVIKAYKKKAAEHHPDRHRNKALKEQKFQEKKFKEVGEALIFILSDPLRQEN